MQRTLKILPFSLLFAFITLVTMGFISQVHTSTTGTHNTRLLSENHKVTINWMTIEQAQDSMKIRPKKIFVDIYTDWCHVCKMLDRKTLSKSRIIKLLNKHYYAVKLNAEKTEPIKFNDSIFFFNKNLGNGIHNLAYHLGKEAETVSYPTIVIIKEDLSLIYRYPSFITVLNLEEVLDLYK